MAAPGTADAIRDLNTRYHDVAAVEYDTKWGIGFGPTGRAQVTGKLAKALGHPPGHYTTALEIGAGTGYFSLNLVQEGVIGAATCTDIAPGMLAALRANADRLGLSVHTRVCDAERLPFPDACFDLVLGHAVLHHIPDLGRAFGEFHRVLRPGGQLVFAGEPSRLGDHLAAVPKRAAVALAPAWRALIGARAAVHEHRGGDHGMEFSVDVHAFAGGELRRHALAAGFQEARVRGEELVAGWFGWSNRTLEGTARPQDVPWLWRQYAYHGYLALQALDTRVLEGRLPPALFYNLILSARRP